MPMLTIETYDAIKDTIWKWYGLANDRANLQVFLEIVKLVQTEGAFKPTYEPDPRD